MSNELERKLSSLKLSGMVDTLSIRNQEAISSKLAYTDFLELLVEDELNKRRDRLFVRLIQAGKAKAFCPSSQASPRPRNQTLGGI